MARKKAKGSTNSLGGIGMLPSQDERILFFMKQNHVPSFKYLVRGLLRKYLEEQEKALPEKERRQTHKMVK